jgi:hypothetical protein
LLLAKGLFCIIWEQYPPAVVPVGTARKNERGRSYEPHYLVRIRSSSLHYHPSFSGSGSDNPVFGPKLLTPLAVRFPIDGVVDLAAVGTIHQKTIDILDNFGTGTVVKTATISWSARNDDRDLYLALEWNDDTQNSFDPSVAMDDFDGIAVVFDNDANGTLANDEDAHRLVMTDFARSTATFSWVNWLPVHDPSGQYLVYLKSVGYTDARLMTKDGRDLGRRIPDDTKVRYIDWK